MHFFGFVIGEVAFGHDTLEDAVGAITASIHVLLKVGCVDVKKAECPPEEAGSVFD